MAEQRKESTYNDGQACLGVRESGWQVSEEVGATLDLSNTHIKRSIEMLRETCHTKRIRLEEERNKMFQQQENNEKLSNQLTMLQYSRTASFKIYSEIKTFLDTVVGKQEQVMMLRDEMVRCYTQAGTFIRSVNTLSDDMKDKEQRRQLLFSSSINNLTHKGRVSLADQKGHLEELESILVTLNQSLAAKEMLDYTTLDRIRTKYRDIREANVQLESNIYQERLELEKLEEEYKEELELSQVQLDKLKELRDNFHDEVVDKETKKLVHLMDEKSELENNIRELTENQTLVQTELNTLTGDLGRKQQRRAKLIDAFQELTVELNSHKGDIISLNALEPVVDEKRCELGQLAETLPNLYEEVRQAERNLADNLNTLELVSNMMTETEESIQDLETSYNEHIDSISLTDNNCNHLQQANQDMRKKINEMEDRMTTKQNLLLKEKEFLESIKQSLYRKCVSLDDKVQNINTQFLEIQQQNCELRNKIKCIMREREFDRMTEEEILTRNETECKETVEKVDLLKLLLQNLDGEVKRLSHFKKFYSDEYDRTAKMHQAQIQEKKTSIEDTKKSQLALVTSKQKQVSAMNSEYNKLCLQRNEVFTLAQQVDNNQQLFACKEMKFKSHLIWATKQFLLDGGSSKKRQQAKIKADTTKSNMQERESGPSKIHQQKDRVVVMKRPSEVETDVSQSVTGRGYSTRGASQHQLKRSNVSSGADRGKKQDSTGSGTSMSVASSKKAKPAGGQVREKDKPSFTVPRPTLHPLNSDTDSDSDSLSSIDQGDSIVINRTQVSQQATPRPLGKIPFIFDQPNNDGKKFEGKFSMTDTSSQEDSVSTVESLGKVKVEKIIRANTSTPIREYEGDSDYSFNRSLKHINKVILKSRALNKDIRVKEQVKKAKDEESGSIICIDSE